MILIRLTNFRKKEITGLLAVSLPEGGSMIRLLAMFFSSLSVCLAFPERSSPRYLHAYSSESHSELPFSVNHHFKKNSINSWYLSFL
ncbi:hypothetical protein WJR50_20595 [Catalinimonas sp. 4WD22]|uniref:hypothetical protein n=1 Tax=Catalinimonas locisalis TaxID=3133978 RepID=UPI003101292B